MARPTVEMRNRAPATASYSRERAAPGLSVEAPLNVSTGPNQFQALAQVLGVATDMVADESAVRRERQIKEENELLLIQAEADSWGDTVDPEKVRQSRIYRDRVSVIQGQRTALELGEKMQVAYKEFREENPLATEDQLREFLSGWKKDNLVDDNDQPLAALSDPRQRALIEGQLGQTAYKIISADRDVLETNTRNEASTAASSSLLSVARQNKGLKVTDYEAMRQQLRAVGWSEEDANKQVVAAALAAAEELESPDPLRVLPDKWSDGRPGPKGDSELARMVDNQADVQQARNDAAAMKALEGERLKWRLAMEAKAAQGIDPTSDEIESGFKLGITAEGIASVFGKARSEREQRKREAEREAREAQRHAETMGVLEGSPWSVDQNKAEDALTREFQNTPGGQRTQLIERWVKERGILPGIYRNYLNHVPIDPGGMATWVGGMKHLRNLDPNTYASLSERARTTFEAWESVRATGKYNDATAFQRVLNRKSDVGRQVAGSKVGQDAVNRMVGSSPTPHARALARNLVETFGSFEDMPQDEAMRLAQKSFDATYFSHDGRVYHKGYARSGQFLDWAKGRFAKDLARRGSRVDPDDLIIAPVGDGSSFTVVERGGITPLTNAPLSADILYRAYREEQKTKAARTAATPMPARDAATKRLDPYRRIPGESGWQRVSRINAENKERARLGLPVVTTPNSRK